MRLRIARVLLFISTVLCLACVILWIESYRLSHSIYHESGRYSRNVLTERVWSAIADSGEVLCYIAWTGQANPGPAALESQRVHARILEHRTLPPGETWKHWKPHIVGPFGFSYRYRNLADDAPDTYGNDGNKVSWVEITFPLWAAVALFALLPSIAAIRASIRRWRIRRLLCTMCGYDLRASKDRCPECGTPIVLPIKNNSQSNT
jgi:hypothetical protein